MRFVLIVLAALGFATASIAQHAEKSAPRFSVAFINPGGETSFWGMVSQTMAAAADDLAIDLEVIHTNRDRIAMLDAARMIAARDDAPDYVVLVNELEQGSAMAQEMARAGIPTFFLLNRLSAPQVAQLGAPEGALLGSITPDNEIAGYEMAKSLFAEAKQRFGADAPIEVLAILGDAATPAALAREAGMRRAVDEEPLARLQRAFPVLWSQEEAYRRAHFALRVLDIDVVWAANDDLAIGAQQAARELNRKPGQDVLFAGLNWSPHGLAGVQSGEMTMTHGGHFFGGAWAMVLLRDIHDGAVEPADHDFAMSAVTPANVDLFLERLADQDWRKIDFTTFSKSYTERTEYDFSADAILAAAAPSEG